MNKDIERSMTDQLCSFLVAQRQISVRLCANVQMILGEGNLVQQVIVLAVQMYITQHTHIPQ